MYASINTYRGAILSEPLLVDVKRAVQVVTLIWCQVAVLNAHMCR